MIWEKVAAIAMIGLSCWQFYASYKAFKHVKHHGNKHTSPFFALGDFYGFYFGAILLVLSITLLLGGFD